jgi:putative ABC transport system permease protein
MKIVNQARLAFCSLSRRRLRAFWMMLGVLVGIAAFTVVTSVGEATRREAMSRVKNMVGTFDTIIIRPGAGKTRGMVSLTNVPATLKFEDAQAIAAEIPDIQRVALVQNAFDIDVKYRDRADSPAVFGVSSNWLAIRGEDVQEGHFFTADDERALARVAVLGGDAQDALFPAENPLDQTIRIADVPFRVLGTLKRRGAGPTGASLDQIILIPVTTASRRLFNRDFLTMMVAQLRQPESNGAAAAAITAKLRDRHHLASTALDDFTVTNPAAVLAQVNRLGSTLSKILQGTAVFSMLIGGTVITALMLIAVTERRREIGTRRALGASRRDILFEFLLEAVLVCVIGGVAGAALSLAGTNLVARFGHLPKIVAAGPLALAMVSSIGTGLVFGVYPAWRAAATDPIVALRS